MIRHVRCLVGFCVTLVIAHNAVAQEHKQAPSPPADSAEARFPLKVSANKRYLVDRDGKPFLIVGDTAWSLIADLTEDDVRKYLDDRQKRGFNSIIVNLIEHRFATDPPRTRAGIEPFKKRGDFSTPNPAYFDFAHKVIELANERGITVWLCPAYLGWEGGDQGFFREIKAGGVEKFRTYGEFVGRRFADLPNIVWMVGGDYAMPREHRWTAINLAVAIRKAGATQLLTAHGGVQSAVETVGEQPWLDVNNTYSYQAELFRELRHDHERKPVRPYVLIESTYENEHDSRPEQIRRQAYWAMTCGACGQFFGNNPIWHFDGPGLFPVKRTWQQELDGTGSRDMSRLGKAFISRPWQALVPDWKDAVVTAGKGRGTATVTTAATPDHKLAMIYIPSTGHDARELAVDLSRFAGPVTGSWYNPTDGRSTPASEKPLPSTGTHRYRTPGDNGTKTNDWLLILEVEP